MTACTSITHDAADCAAAGLPLRRWCGQCREAWRGVPPEVSARYLSARLADAGYDARPWRDSIGWCCDYQGGEYHTEEHDWRAAAPILIDRLAVGTP